MKIKKILSLVLAVVIIFTGTFSISNIITKAENKKYMLYWENEELMGLTQYMEISSAETYVVTYSAATDAEIAIGCWNGGDQNSIIPTVNEIGREQKSGYVTVTSEIQVPTTLADGVTARSNSIFVGLMLQKASTGYLLNLSVYKKSDENKTELCKTGDLSTGNLNYWGVNKKYGGSAGGYFAVTWGDLKGEHTEYTFTYPANAYLKVMDYDESLFGGEKEFDNMLYWENEGLMGLTQYISFIANETYVMSYTVATEAAVKVGLWNGGAQGSMTPVISEIERVQGDGYYTVTSEVTIPEKDNSGTVLQSGAFLGIELADASTGYLLDLSVYKKDDAEKTELCRTGDLSTGNLNYWGVNKKYGGSAGGYFAVTWGDLKGEHTEYTFTTPANAYLKVMEYDKETIKNGSTSDDKEDDDIVKPKLKNMLYWENEGLMGLTQYMEISSAETYVLTYSVSTDTEVGIGCWNGGNQNSIIPVVKELSRVQDNKYYTVTSEVQVPATLADGTTARAGSVFLGIMLNDASSGYLLNLSVYKKGDENKTELCRTGDLTTGNLNYWGVNKKYGGSAGGYFAVTWGDLKGEHTEYTFTYPENAYLQVLKYDESKLDNKQEEEEDDGEIAQPKFQNMLHWKNEGLIGLTQYVSVVADQTYIVTYTVSSQSAVTVGLWNGGAQTMIAPAVKELNRVKTDNYWTVKSAVTIPATDSLGAAVGNGVFLGIKMEDASEGYLLNLSIYKKGDKRKTELCRTGDLTSGNLNYWGVNQKYGGSSGGYFAVTWGDLKGEHTEYSFESPAVANLQILKYNEALLEGGGAGGDIVPEVLAPGKKMVYFENGTLPTHFAARIKAEAGVKYRFTYSTYNTEEADLEVRVTINGNRGVVTKEAPLVERVDHGNYYTSTHEFSVTEEHLATDGCGGLFFVGVWIPIFSKGYIFDMSCYKADDPQKTELFKNAQFEESLNEWIWGWTIWFGISNGAIGITNWTNSVDTVRLRNYDLANIDAFIDELNYDDGKWWSDSDIIEKNDKVGIATVSGKLKDQNNNPMKDVKLVLESDDNTYTTTTNYKGEFVFKDIVAEYYEMYCINQNGEKIYMEYTVNLKDGDLAKVEFVCDSSQTTLPEELPNTDDSEAEKPATSSFNGTVYTPKLKTVSDLKIYLRDFGEVVTDANGYFEFNDVPVGTYELYTVNKDGTENIFRTVEIKENVELSVKLKYEEPKVKTEVPEKQEKNYTLLIIIIVAAVVLVIAGIVIWFIMKKKRAK